MTITLYWWMLPILIFFAGALFAWRYDDGGGILSGLTNGLVLVAAVLVSVAIVIGHFL